MHTHSQTVYNFQHQENVAQEEEDLDDRSRTAGRHRRRKHSLLARKLAACQLALIQCSSYVLLGHT
jgi:hypothetical protein